MATTLNKKFQLQKLLIFYPNLLPSSCEPWTNFTTVATVDTSGLAEPGGERLSLELHKSPVPGELEVNIINSHKPDNQIISLQTKHS